MGGMPMYGASKAALDSLTYAWAQEVRLYSEPERSNEMSLTMPSIVW